MATTFSASWEFQAAIQSSAGDVFFCAATIWTTRSTINTMVEIFFTATSCQTASQTLAFGVSAQGHQLRNILAYSLLMKRPRLLDVLIAIRKLRRHQDYWPRAMGEPEGIRQISLSCLPKI